MGQWDLCKQMTNESIFSFKENDLLLEKDNTMVFEVKWTLYVTFLNLPQVKSSSSHEMGRISFTLTELL